ncbi:MAG: cell division protein FtsW [Treponema sp.]|nr:cell division protein FtsW [Treponema sp.]
MSSFTFFADRPVERYRKSDAGLIVAIVLLWGLGLCTLCVCTPSTAQRLFNDKYYFIFRQLMCSAVGFAGLFVFAQLPIKKIRAMLPLLVLATFILCLMTFLPGIGDARKGAPRWIRIPHVATFQPSELAKFVVVLFLANLFDKQLDVNDDTRKSFWYPLSGLLLFVGVVFLQKDFSTGLFIFAIGCIMFFVCGAKMDWFLPLILLAVPAAALMIAIEPYRINRLVAFFKPGEYVLTSGYQQFASRRAIITGGLWGMGMGTGLDKVSSIPEVQTDYIFAGWASAMGLLGVTAYFALLVFFAWRGYVVAFTSPDRFAAFGCFGCTSIVVLQSIMNCAVVCGAAPTTGIPLPFFSSGGSSLIVTLCMCGFMVNASHCEGPDISAGTVMSGGASQGFDAYDVQF